MPSLDLKATGSGELVRVVRRLKDQDKILKKELKQGIERAAKPLEVAARQAAAREYPRRGGLAARIARLRLTTHTTTSGAGVDVKFSVSGGVNNMAALDEGRVVHPVFGGKVRVVQDVAANVIPDAFDRNSPKVRAEINQAVHDMAKKVEG